MHTLSVCMHHSLLHIYFRSLFELLNVENLLLVLWKRIDIKIKFDAMHFVFWYWICKVCQNCTTFFRKRGAKKTLKLKQGKKKLPDWFFIVLVVKICIFYLVNVKGMAEVIHLIDFVFFMQIYIAHFYNV